MQADRARLTGHSHTRPVLEVARRAAVGRLLLKHLNPVALDDDPVGLEDARGLFPATALAVDGMAVAGNRPRASSRPTGSSSRARG